MNTVLQKGFTILELIAALAILAIITSVAVPAMSNIIRSNQTESTSQLLFSAMVAARSEAVARNLSVVLCKSPNGIFCATTNDWEQGWLIYVDADGDGTKDITDPITGSYSAIDADFTLRTGSAYTNKLEFRADGSVAEVGTFRLCGTDSDTAKGRSIILNITGRPRLTDGVSECP
jgi:type IV fimbrial biogenesis protein FimT